MIHLRKIDIHKTGDISKFPYNIQVIQNWAPIELISAVTFFVGENGTGKSTLLEAIAAAIGSITVGSEGITSDPTLKEILKFSKSMKLVWNKRTHRGFFLRAEDFFGYVKRLNKTRAELENDLKRVEAEYADRSVFAKNQAKMAYTRELHDLHNRYGDGLDAHSHGESYLELFQTRFVPGGLYLLDEPEAALSPLRQLGFLSLLKEMVKKEAQFIISTHSPILMAYPGAELLTFDQAPIRKIEWESLEHVKLTRDFLNNPEGFLRYI